MPRDFDSDDSSVTLRFFENVTCPVCGEVFESTFEDQGQSLSVGDMTDPPVGNHQCPTCEHEWTSESTGWSFFSEAG